MRTTLLDFVHLTSTISILSFALFAYERSVEPLYGYVPTHYYLPHLISASTLISAFTPALGVRLFGFSLFAAAITSYRIAALSARHCDSTWGPVITHLLVLAPVFYLAVSMHQKVSKSVWQFLGTCLLTFDPEPILFKTHPHWRTTYQIPASLLGSVASSTPLLVNFTPSSVNLGR